MKILPAKSVGLGRRVVLFELSTRSIIAAVLVIAVVWVLVRLWPVLLVLIAALMLVGTLSPAVAWLERHKMHRNVGIGIVFGVASALIALLLFLVVPSLVVQFKDLVEHEPEIRGRLADYLAGSSLTAPLAEELRNLQYQELLKSSNALVFTMTKQALAMVAYTVGAIFLALYVMIDRDRLRGGMFAFMPRKHHVRFSRVLLNLETIVGGYIRGQVITCALMTVFILAVLLICRVPNALAIAVFGGIADVLPYIGVFLTMGPAVAAGYIVSPAIGLTVFALLFLYEEFESRVLLPLVYGRALRLPSSVVFFALLVGAALGGIIGALLALPMAAAAVMLIDELRVELPGETIQPEDVETRRKDQREEREYEHRTEMAPAEEAAAVAVEIARERKEEEAETEKAGK
ncbi:MAG: AI-2E family transporter [Opitutaceae bacterium]|nr:AI-2E family transporter [Opitutaceae bacterium]